MNVKIDKNGDVWVERAGEWIKGACYCTEDFVQCNHSCMMFDEYTGTNAKIDKGIVLSCGGERVYATLVIDERLQAKGDESP